MDVLGKKIIPGSILIGISLQVPGWMYAPEQYTVSVILAGIGLVCAGAAGIVGKEACYFSCREGWVLLWFFPAVIIVNLVAKEKRLSNFLAFSTIFLLFLSLVGTKLKQPLLSKCTTNVCGEPEKK